jgi:hypothetical protein
LCLIYSKNGKAFPEVIDASKDYQPILIDITHDASGSAKAEVSTEDEVRLQASIHKVRTQIAEIKSDNETSAKVLQAQFHENEAYNKKVLKAMEASDKATKILLANVHDDWRIQLQEKPTFQTKMELL